MKMNKNCHVDLRIQKKENFLILMKIKTNTPKNMIKFINLVQVKVKGVLISIAMILQSKNNL